MNKWLFVVVLVLFASVPSFAQIPGMMGGMGGGQGKDTKGKMNIGRFYGKLVDGKDGKPVPSATVILTKEGAPDKKTGKKKPEIVKVTNSAGNGEFSLDEIPVLGTYKITITEVGYKTYEKQIYFDLSAMSKLRGMNPDKVDISQGMPSGASAALNALDKDMGNIKLTPDEKDLQGVTITGNTPQFRLEGEKKIFDVEKNLVSQGGTAQDVMKNVPGVIVDINNNVTLRNATPVIYVDGQPTTLSLDQIPADMIESVEIITNPSAKYDASAGAGGIINIVLKKNKKKGYNGDVRAGVDSHGGYNAGGDFDVRQGKINFSANAMMMDINSLTTGYTDRTNAYETPNTIVDQNNHLNTLGGFDFVRMGLDYFVTNRMTISATGMFAAGGFDPTSDYTSTSDTLRNPAAYGYSKQHSVSHNNVKFGSYTLNMKHLFAREGEEWTALATYNGANFNTSSNYTTTLYNDAAYTNQAGQFLQSTTGTGLNHYYIGQTDFTYPFSPKSKVETGVKATQQDLNSYNNNMFDDTEVAFANLNYTSTQNIYAGYATYTSAIGQYSYHLGLRAESSDYTGKLTTTDSSFKQSYPVSLFPSAFVSRKLKHDQELQFSYRRGITRPTFFQMVPFTNYSDPLNITQGNPGLKPGFNNSVEFNYLKNMKSNSYVMVSLYYKHTEGLITPYQNAGINPVTRDSVIINSYINATSSDRYGTELTSQQTIKKWWNILADLNIYNGSINAANIPGSTPQGSIWSWFGKLNNNFTLPKNFTIQLSGVYQSKTNLLPDNNSNGMNSGSRGSMSMAASAAEGYLAANYSIDLAIKKSFLKNNAATVSLSVNDIFRTRVFLEHSQTTDFIQDYSQLKDPQLVRLNFSWRFGKLDMDLFKHKDIKSEGENMKNAQDNFMN